jgi:hypothetical protein
MSVSANLNPPDKGITMWGPPASGKTTFLAALNVALARQQSEWRLNGEDEASTDRLIKLTTGLTRDRVFPIGTTGIEHHHWTLTGQLPRNTRRHFWQSPQRHDGSVRVRLDIADAAGDLTGPRRSDASSRAGLIENMARSSAIIFTYDPVREFERGDTFDHTVDIIAQLSQGLREMDADKLPQYVAICVTKFDEIRVFRTAEKLDLLTYDLGVPGFPRIAEDDAREFFLELCQVSRSGNALLALNLIEQSFRPDRLKFFVTSSIGFYVHQRTGIYDSDDYQNVLPATPDGTGPQIRGNIYPINVAEPLLWLSGKLAGKP